MFCSLCFVHLSRNYKNKNWSPICFLFLFYLHSKILQTMTSPHWNTFGWPNPNIKFVKTKIKKLYCICSKFIWSSLCINWNYSTLVSSPFFAILYRSVPFLLRFFWGRHFMWLSHKIENLPFLISITFCIWRCT